MMNHFARVMIAATVFIFAVSTTVGQALAAAPVLVKHCTATKPWP